LTQKVRAEMSWDCQGCKTRVRIEYTAEPGRTGAMSTVDCPVCGTNKMIPDVAERIFYRKDGNWIETQPKAHYAF